MYEAEGRTSRPKPGPAEPAAAAAIAEDEKKTKKQLVDELQALRQRIRDLEAFESERKAIATELKGTRQRLQYLLAVSPAIIYTTKASGDYACTFVSENLRSIMGYTPQEMTTDPKGWPDHLHPELLTCRRHVPAEEARRARDERLRLDPAFCHVVPRPLRPGRGSLPSRGGRWTAERARSR